MHLSLTGAGFRERLRPCRMRSSPIRFVCLYGMVLALAQAEGDGTMSSASQPPAGNAEARVEELLSQLTLEEKLSLLSGADGGSTKEIPRVGIPSLRMMDGPHGVGWGTRGTAFPTPVNMAATWNPALVYRTGVALGEETLAAGRQVLLGPCVNIHRVPLGGRNFESFGEDPYLAGRMAVAYIQGVQETGAGTALKHFACNNQETERMTVDAKVDDRALYEIYLPAFRAAVTEARPWMVMAAYNQLNGHYCSANRRLLTEILKQEWGFAGVAVSDWGGCHSTVEAANAGLDLEMPGPGYHLNAEKLGPAIRDGQVAADVIDDKVRRILRMIDRAGLFDDTPAPPGAASTPEHQALARQLAQESLVLLKNDDALLPLQKDRLKRIAVIGPNAAVARVGGGGSSTVAPPYAISPLDGLREFLGDGVEIRYVEGCALNGEIVSFEPESLRTPDGKEQGVRAEYFTNQNLEGAPALVRTEPRINFDWAHGSPDPTIPGDHFSARWTGELIPPETGDVDLAISSDDGSRVFLDDELVIDHWSDHGPEIRTRRVHLEKGRTYKLRVEYYEKTGEASVRFGRIHAQDAFVAATKAAADADLAIVVGGLSHEVEMEGRDRDAMRLPGLQSALIAAVAAANPRTVVVLNGGLPAEMPWLNAVRAVVQAWYPGLEGGRALADVLFGVVNPSGRLPMTFPKRYEDAGCAGFYPGKAVVQYGEGIYVGYRHFDKREIEPLFPFGHGLSYTSFKYSNLRAETGKFPNARISVDVENTGPVAGQEVVQVYVRDVESMIDKPVKELRRFQKIALAPGEKKTVDFALGDDAFWYYDTKLRRYQVEQGAYEILVGSSSRDIRARTTIGLKW